MRIAWQSTLLGLILALAFGCVSSRQLEPYPHSHRAYDLAIDWKTSKQGAALTIAGTATNVRFAQMKGLELTATLLDGSDKVLAEKTFLFIPQLIRMDESAPFTITLPYQAGTVPAKLRFFYRYRYGEERHEGILDFHSFEVELP